MGLKKLWAVLWVIDWVQTGFGIALADKGSLSETAGYSQTRGTTILVDTRFADDTVNWIVIRDSLRKRLHYDGGYAFTARIAVCGDVPHGAAAIWREHTKVAFGNVHGY